MAREVVPGIYELDTRAFGYERLIASYLLLGSDKKALLDPGLPSSLDALLKEITDADVKPEELDYIIITHSHMDHAGSVGALARFAPDARIICHKRGAFYLKNPVKITGGALMVFGPEIVELIGEPEPVPEELIRMVDDGDTIELGSFALEVLYTPGHSGDHISLFESNSGLLFTGDTACLNYPDLNRVLIPAGSPPIYRADYIIEELERLKGLDVRKVLTPHFGETDLEAQDFLGKNCESVRKTRDKIVQLQRDGLEFQQVVERLRNEIFEASEKRVDDVPQFLSETWIRAMLKTGLMGYMADIMQYARDLRPFHDINETGQGK